MKNVLLVLITFFTCIRCHQSNSSKSEKKTKFFEKSIFYKTHDGFLIDGIITSPVCIQNNGKLD